MKPATLLLAAVLVGVYALELAGGGMPVCELYGLVPAHASFRTALSSLFLHDPSSLFHLGGNLAFLLVFGAIVEGELGSLRFLALFAAAGLGGAALHVVVDPSSATPLVGASGALFGLLAVSGALRPRLLGFALAFVGLNVWRAFFGGDEGVSFACHLGGFVVGALVVVFMRICGSEELEAA